MSLDTLLRIRSLILRGENVSIEGEGEDGPRTVVAPQTTVSIAVRLVQFDKLYLDTLASYVERGKVQAIIDTTVLTPNQIRELRRRDLSEILGTVVPHDLVGPMHLASGLTPTHVLTALTPTTFGFAPAPGGVLPWTEIQTVYVAKHGNDANGGRSIYDAKLTIQAAVSSITDATQNKQYVIQIGPGRYIETVTMTNWIHLRGLGDKHQPVELHQDSARALLCPPLSDFYVENMLISGKSGNPGSIDPIMTVPSSAGAYDQRFFNCHFQYDLGGGFGTALEFRSGNVVFDNCTFLCDTGSTPIGANVQRMFYVNDGASLRVFNSELRMRNNDVDDRVVIIDDDPSGVCAIEMRDCRVEVEQYHAGYAGTVVFYNALSQGREKRFQNNYINLQGLRGDAYCYYLNQAGGEEVFSKGNDVRVEGFDNNYYTYHLASDSLWSHFDAVLAKDGVDAASTGRHYFAYSDIPQDFSLSQDLRVGRDGWFGRDASVDRYLWCGTANPNPFRFPNVDGAAGEILQTNGSGILSWVNAAAGETFALQAGRRFSITNAYLNGPGMVPTNLAGFVLPFNARIIGIGAATSGVETWVAQVRKNNTATVIASLSLSAVDKGYTSASVDVNAGDELQMYCNGSAINNPSIVVYLQRR